MALVIGVKGWDQGLVIRAEEAVLRDLGSRTRVWGRGFWP